MLWNFWLFFLGLFLILYGVFAVSNLQIEWGSTILGYSALIAGILTVAVLWSGGRRK